MKKALAHGDEVSREDLTTQSKGFVVKVTSLEQHNRISKLGHIGTVTCRMITTGPLLQQYNSVKGLVYIREFDTLRRDKRRMCVTLYWPFGLKADITKLALFS